MKRVLIICASVFLAGLGHADGQEKKTEEAKPKDKKDQISYSIGVNIGQNIATNKIDVNHEYFSQGFKDGLAGKNSFLTAEEVKKVMADLQGELVQKQLEEMKAKSSKNLAEGEKFLKTNKKKKGVKTLPSGLQYRVINPGKGDSPKMSDTVVTNYRGKLLDGTEFDSSYTKNKPATLPVSGVIPGWSEALTLMKPGAKWEIYVPSKLAYGEQSPSPLIGANACLTFEVELVGIEAPKEEAVAHEVPKEPEFKE
jgi:FKBP-type peptidyl-prolyl cis-trans isomerase FklB